MKFCLCFALLGLVAHCATPAAHVNKENINKSRAAKESAIKRQNTNKANLQALALLNDCLNSGELQVISEAHLAGIFPFLGSNDVHVRVAAAKILDRIWDQTPARSAIVQKAIRFLETHNAHGVKEILHLLPVSIWSHFDKKERVERLLHILSGKMVELYESPMFQGYALGFNKHFEKMISILGKHIDQDQSFHIVETFCSAECTFTYGRCLVFETLVKTFPWFANDFYRPVDGLEVSWLSSSFAKESFTMHAIKRLLLVLAKNSSEYREHFYEMLQKLEQEEYPNMVVDVPEMQSFVDDCMLALENNNYVPMNSGVTVVRLLENVLNDPKVVIPRDFGFILKEELYLPEPEALDLCYRFGTHSDHMADVSTTRPIFSILFGLLSHSSQVGLLESLIDAFVHDSTAIHLLITIHDAFKVMITKQEDTTTLSYLARSFFERTLSDDSPMMPINHYLYCCKTMVGAISEKTFQYLLTRLSATKGAFSPMETPKLLFELLAIRKPDSGFMERQPMIAKYGGQRRRVVEIHEAHDGDSNYKATFPHDTRRH